MPDGNTPALRDPITVHADGVTTAIIIDSASEAGRSVLARWSHIPDEERPKWGRVDTRTLEQVSADIDAAFGFKPSAVAR